eukprot:574775-Amphidinium_carterae.2
MRTLSLLLAEGATVLYKGSTEHEEFLDGRGCLYLINIPPYSSNSRRADLPRHSHHRFTVEEPELVVEWNRPRAECFYD